MELRAHMRVYRGGRVAVGAQVIKKVAFSVTAARAAAWVLGKHTLKDLTKLG